MASPHVLVPHNVCKHWQAVRKGEKELVVSYKGIALHYVRGWFFVDFISSIPFDMLAYYLFHTGNANLMRVLKLARILRIAKIVRIVQAGHMLEVNTTSC